MRLSRGYWMLGFVLLCAGAGMMRVAGVHAASPAPAAVSPGYDKSGPNGVETFKYEWTDAARKREIPVKIYMPKSSGATDKAAPLPLIIFSHGLGGNRDTYEYLGNLWASWGYVCVHVQHHGSDTAAFMQDAQAHGGQSTLLGRAASHPENLTNRPADISFAIDTMLKLNKGETVGGVKDDPFKSRLNPESIGVAGHSFGGYTAMAIAGQRFGMMAAMGDPRVKAVIAMSPPANLVAPRNLGDVHIPVLIMTGTLDDNPMLGGTPAGRTELFNDLTHTDRYLCIFTGGDHMVFAGHMGEKLMATKGMKGTNGDPAKDAVFQKFIKASTVAFWKANLQEDGAAKEWLQKGDAKAALGVEGTWQFKAGVK